MCQIWGKSVHKGLLCKWVKYNEFSLFIYLYFFRKLSYPTGETRRQIFALKRRKLAQWCCLVGSR